jgi:phosphoesterase RecJ-like protein
MGKKAIILNQDRPAPCYNFLPGIGRIARFKAQLKKMTYDCFVALDCSDLKRTGGVWRMSPGAKTILNIDHHVSNQMFGDVNWVEPKASSCCEMVYGIFKKMRLGLDKDTAMCIYAGILTDTGSFRYSNTNALTHKIAAHLIAYGLDPRRIYKNIYEDIPFPDANLISSVLPDISRSADGKIIWFQVKRSMYRGKKLSIDLTEHLLNFARSIKDVEVCVLFRENISARGEIRVNLRSQGRVDVNKIAALFGGGGHPTASGCTISGRIDAVAKKVLAAVRRAINDMP